MKKIMAIMAALVLTGLCAVPVMAQLALSPASVEVDVPADGSSQVEFFIYDFAGDLEISLEDIPLTVEPDRVSVEANAEGSKVVLTLYGDETLGSGTYTGYIRFLARTGDMVAMGIKVRATVNHIDEEGHSVDPKATADLTIADIVATDISYYGATITWKTSADATSLVFYDTVSREQIEEYPHQADEGTGLVTEHSVRLTGLSSGTRYYYRVRSVIPGTNFVAESDEFTFTTRGLPGAGLPLSPSPLLPVSGAIIVGSIAGLVIAGLAVFFVRRIK